MFTPIVLFIFIRFQQLCRTMERVTDHTRRDDIKPRSMHLPQGDEKTRERIFIQYGLGAG